MSKMGDYALALWQEERMRGELDERQRQEFLILYTKDRLKKKNIHPADNGHKQQDK